ncbi:MAG: MBL fold metallo-hydrolase [Ruminococcaceae bacterium]|nr:MBL fold metallo-hydrolase [Oscillospiraceae bacterium]
MAKRKHTSPVSPVKRGIFISLIVLTLAAVILYCIVAYRKTGTIFPTLELFDGKPTIHFIDVGQGDCTLVTYKGDSVLIDAGPVSSGMVAAEYVRMYAPVIEYFIITHPHEDHMGGATFIFDAVKVENLVLSTDTVMDEFYVQTLALAYEEGTNIIYLDAPAEFTIGEISVTVLDTFGVEYDDLNDASMMVRIDIEGTSLLITGDAEAVEEAYVLEHNNPALLDCDIMKIAHHGSSTSTSEAFLEAVSPETCVISCGRGNSYGHPSSVVVERIRDYGAEIRRTDTEGTIRLRVNSN